MGHGHSTVNYDTAVSAPDLQSCINYLRLSLDSIQTACNYLQLPESDGDLADNKLASGLSNSPARGINFYRRQCEVVIEHLIQIQKRLLPIADGNIPTEIKNGQGPERQWPMHAMIELYRVVTTAENLIKDCCEQQSCLKAALKQAVVRSQNFAEICREIVWWTSIMYFPEAKMDYENEFMLEEAAQGDLEMVMGEVKKLIEDHTCSAEVCGSIHQNGDFCLAAQALRRWDGENIIALHGEISLPSFNRPQILNVEFL